MKMASMKMAPPRNGDQPDGPMSGCDNGEMYPYGMRLRLEDEQLAALGLKTLPAVGQSITLTARAKVISVRSEETTGKGGKAGEDRSVEVQITDCAIDSGRQIDAEKSAAALYSNPGQKAGQ